MPPGRGAWVTRYIIPSIDEMSDGGVVGVLSQSHGDIVRYQSHSTIRLHTLPYKEQIMKRVATIVVLVAVLYTPVGIAADDAETWTYHERVDELTDEVTSYLIIWSEEEIQRTYDTPARVAIICFCSTKNLVIWSSDALFHGDMDTSGRFRQETRLRIDDGEVATYRWTLPEDWLNASSLYGGSRAADLLVGDTLRIELKYIVTMESVKSVLTFKTTGWHQAFQQFCDS